MALKRLAVRTLIAATLGVVIGVLPAARSQDTANNPTTDAQQIPKRCNPVIIRKSKLKQSSIHVRDGEKSTGYPPIVAFQIAASGEVLGGHVKRSSGIRDMDDSALIAIRSWKYNSRPGCPMIDAQAVVLIDHR